MDSHQNGFIELSAHKLRRHLTVIRGSAELLRDVSLPEEAKKLVQNIDTSAQFLNLLVADILEGTQIEDNTLPIALQQVSISNVVGDVVDRVRPIAEKNGLQVTFERPTEELYIEADPIRLQEVVLQVAENAVYYTQKGSITISIGEKDAAAVIVIVDTGVGISAEDQTHLFQKFFRSEASNENNVAGTGLGLWIAKELTERMGGTILLRSEIGRGTTVEISFPLVS